VVSFYLLFPLPACIRLLLRWASVFASRNMDMFLLVFSLQCCSFSVFVLVRSFVISFFFGSLCSSLFVVTLFFLGSVIEFFVLLLLCSSLSFVVCSSLFLSLCASLVSRFFSDLFLVCHPLFPSLGCFYFFSFFAFACGFRFASILLSSFRLFVFFPHCCFVEADGHWRAERCPSLYGSYWNDFNCQKWGEKKMSPGIH
jgi:hypothetical protein